jgi:hypothetical protein
MEAIFHLHHKASLVLNGHRPDFELVEARGRFGVWPSTHLERNCPNASDSHASRGNRTSSLSHSKQSRRSETREMKSRKVSRLMVARWLQTPVMKEGPNECSNPLRRNCP